MAREGVSLEVRGTEDLKRLSAALTQAANGRELRRDLGRNIRLATRPSINEAKTNLRTSLPKHGGLADYFGRVSIGTRTSLSGRSAGVRIVASRKGNDIQGLDRGVVRHPLFGKPRWYAQRVTPGLISQPLQDSKPEVRRGVLEAMDNVANKIARSS